VAQLTSEDGMVLTVLPVPVLDRDGQTYEHTLTLLLDGEPFGEVGERCGWFLSQVLEQLRDGLPESDGELCCFRSRDPDDLPTEGELRVCVRTEREWTGAGWDVLRLAVVDAFGDGSRGVRVLVTASELLAFVEVLVQDCGAAADRQA
jgi:hypothetical protein